MIIRIARMAAAMLAAILFFTVPANAYSAQSAIMMDGQTGDVLYEKNADDRALIASTTKIMTAVIVCEQCNVLDRVRIPQEAVGIEGSSMYLQAGEILTVQELLYGLMLHSGNDAAVALAIYCGGTVEGFTQLMNDKARSLGMEHSHFANPNGLDHPDHYSTARDMAILAAYAMNNPIFAQTVSTKTITLGQRSLRNHNKLLWSVEGAEGIKTGYTKAAGRSLVSSAKRMDRRIIVVTINAPDDWNDHKELYELGFSKYEMHKLIDKGDCLGAAPVLSGQSNTVSLIADENISYALADGEQAYYVLPQVGPVYAPVSKGQNAGSAHIFVGGWCIGTVPLIYGNTVEMECENIPFWKKIF